MILELGVRVYSGAADTRWFDNELGVVELATTLCSALGVVAGIAALRHRTRLPTGWLQAWVALVTLACVYLTGEELSWGQHLFGWSTPESLMAVNDQGETNLHNISSWLDQKPRMLLELFVLYGGIIRVLMRRGDSGERGLAYLGSGRLLLCLPSAPSAIPWVQADRLEELLSASARLARSPSAGANRRSITSRCSCSCISCRFGIGSAVPISPSRDERLIEPRRRGSWDVSTMMNRWP